MEGHGRGTKVLQRMTYLHVPTQRTCRLLSRRFGLNIALWSPGLNCGPIGGVGERESLTISTR